VNYTDDDAFTIKSGRKRKADAVAGDAEQPKSKGVPMSDRPAEPHISLNQEEEQKARDKAALKAEKKARKKFANAQRKLAQENGIASALPEEGQEEDFDYSKAESVLHGKRKDGGMNGPKGKKPFDPYAKSSDAPKGMRKLQTERPGKSFTFKS
jgi:exosome complex exonuclease RRP6